MPLEPSETRTGALLAWEHPDFSRDGKRCCCKQDDPSSLGLLALCILILVLLSDLSLNPPVLKSSSMLDTSWTGEALVIYRVGVKGVWSCGLQFSECTSVPVADAISYGFSLGKRFASSFCRKFTGKRERHSVHMEYSPRSRATHSSAVFFLFLYIA